MIFLFIWSNTINNKLKFMGAQLRFQFEFTSSAAVAAATASATA